MAMKLGTSFILSDLALAGPEFDGGGGWGGRNQAGALEAPQNSWGCAGPGGGGGEWGLAFAGKLISFGCCSLQTGA